MNKDGTVDNYDYDVTGKNASVRSNAGLKSLINQARKIYRYDFKTAKDTHPERFSGDEDEREANLYQGHMRKDDGRVRWHYGDKDRYFRDKSKMGSDIQAARAAFDAGDISRKEMEQRIEKAKADKRDMSWLGKGAQRDLNQRADDRYYAANKKLRAPIEKLNDLRQ